MSELSERLLKQSTVKMTDLLLDSSVFDPADAVPTAIPMVNVALSGSMDGGLMPGVTVLAGKSKMFKTGFALMLAAAFLKKHADGYILFYDSEFGSPPDYFHSFDIPLDRVVHTPVTELEELRHDLAVQLNGLTRKDKVFIIIDSIGNLPSHKEMEDATKGSDAGDMGLRAKVAKSVFRVVSGKANLKHIPVVVIAHTYGTMELYSKEVVAGGTGPYYSADNVWLIGRQQEKDKDNKVAGFNFIINVDKSRYVKERSKIPVSIAFDGGINRWSGLLAEAIEGGYVCKPGVGWYQEVDRFTGEATGTKMREADIEENGQFWTRIIQNTDFAEFVKNKYTLAGGLLIGEAEHVE